MSNRKDLKQLIELSNKARKQMKLEMKVMDKTFDEMTQKLPEEEAKEVANLKALNKKAIALAKEGKADEAQEIIKNYRDERQGRKT